MKRSFEKVLVNVKGESVQCSLSYSPRARYMRMQVSSLKGLEVIIPNGMNSSKVLEFIKEHENWIGKKLKKPKNEITYLGKELTLIKKVSSGDKYYNLSLSGDSLIITGAFTREISLNFLYEQWLYLHAKRYLVIKTNSLAKLHGFKFNKVTVRRQTSRWGSCSRKGNISLNFKLLKYQQEIIDYVIFHELCHLKQMNHSVKFWKLVEMYVPDYKEIRKKLKE